MAAVSGLMPRSTRDHTTWSAPTSSMPFAARRPGAGALVEAAARGIDVPGQLGIMGFGDFDFAEHTHPAISSVHVDKRDIGARAARALIAKIAGKALRENVIDVGFRLVERETTRGGG